MSFINNTDTLVEEKTLTLEEVMAVNSLIVHNDEVNTFDDVIEALMDICKHTAEQAEQCTYLIHHKGKAQVRHGALEDLRPLKDAICDRGIQATIE
jgi:ATP-dependent Clp protease adaptor protein ClpS